MTFGPQELGGLTFFSAEIRVFAEGIPRIAEYVTLQALNRPFRVHYFYVRQAPNPETSQGRDVTKRLP